MPNTATQEVWLRTGAATEALGVSADTLRRRVKDKFLTEGTHWIRSGPSKQHMKLWNLSACKEVFGTWKAPKGGQG